MVRPAGAGFANLLMVLYAADEGCAGSYGLQHEQILWREKSPALWAGKAVALITTCGYRPEQGADLWEDGVKRYCKHSRLVYMGMLAERHMGYDTAFMDEGKAKRAEAFARQVVARPVLPPRMPPMTER